MSILDPILDIKMPDAYGGPQIEDLTIRKYLHGLLTELIVEEEGFSGKRPFGNSGWIGDFEKVFVVNGVINGEVNEYGDAEAENYNDVTKLLTKLIDHVFGVE